MNRNKLLGQSGEYQDGIQASTCKRCPIGEYQELL